MIKKKKKEAKQGGRPTDYKESYPQDIVEYFQRCQQEILVDLEFYNASKFWEIQHIKNPIDEDDWPIGTYWLKKVTQKMVVQKFPTFQRRATNIGVHIDTLHERAKVYKPFSESKRKCKLIQEAILIENWLTGMYNATMVQFMLKNNHWYSDKQEHEHSWSITSITLTGNESLKELEEKRKALLW